MKRQTAFVFTILIGFTLFSVKAWALHPVPATMKKLNVKCPVPKACRKLERTRDICLLNEKLCDDFVEAFAVLLPEYDCSFNKMTDNPKVTVSAIWKCESIHTGITYSALAGVKTLNASRIYASEAFRNSLNGPTGAIHYGPSLEREKQLRAAGYY